MITVETKIQELENSCLTDLGDEKLSQIVQDLIVALKALQSLAHLEVTFKLTGGFYNPTTRDFDREIISEGTENTAQNAINKICGTYL